VLSCFRGIYDPTADNPKQQQRRKNRFVRVCTSGGAPTMQTATTHAVVVPFYINLHKSHDEASDEVPRKLYIDVKSVAELLPSPARIQVSRRG